MGELFVDTPNEKVKDIAQGLLTRALLFHPDFNKDQLVELILRLQNSANKDHTSTEDLLEAYELAYGKLTELSEEDIARIREILIQNLE